MSRRDAEKALEEQMETNRARLLAERDLTGLLATLKNEIPDLSDNLYVISSIPEEVVDVYEVLVDAETVVHAEIPRHPAESGVVVKTMSLDEYLKSHSLTKFARRPIDTAIRLAWARRG
jgi:hypothetical protein